MAICVSSPTAPEMASAAACDSAILHHKLCQAVLAWLQQPVSVLPLPLFCALLVPALHQHAPPCHPCSAYTYNCGCGRIEFPAVDRQPQAPPSRG
jgi:hypothetical protein